MKRLHLSIIGAAMLWATAVAAQSSLWQLTFNYSPAGLSLVRASPIGPTLKDIRTPGLAGAPLKLDYELEWRDADGQVVLKRPIRIPLGTRSALGGVEGRHEVAVPDAGAFVIRVEGPSDPRTAASVRLIKTPDAAGLRIAPALAPPRAFLNPEHQFDLPPLQDSKAISPAAGPVGSIKLRDNGPDANRLVLVVMGDGFTQADLNAGRWANPANSFVQSLFFTSPWDDYETAVNVYRIDIASNEAGADYEDGPPGSGTLKDTYLGAGFWSGSVERCVYLSAEGTTRAILAADAAVGVGLWDEILVFVNSSKDGGCAGFLAVSSMTFGFATIQVHELGHSFANLADEYEGSSSPVPCSGLVARNVDCGASFPHVRWDPWVTPGTPIPTPEDYAYFYAVGAFEGAAGFNQGFYRPMQECKMRTREREFCPVCKEAHVLELFNRLRLVDDAFPPPGPIGVPANGTVTFVLTPIHIPDLVYQWSLGGVTIFGGSSLTITSDQLTCPAQELRVAVRHSSPLVRSEVIKHEVRWALSRAISEPVNSWTKPSSGYWEEPFWSLGELPSLEHGTVAITNAGFKAVAIGGGTVSTFPGSLTVSDLVVSAPPNSGNLLLLNYSGLQTPLRVLKNFYIGPNGHLLHLYALLRVEGQGGGGLFVDGLARHAELAQLIASRVAIGCASPGEYHFTNGIFIASNLTVAAGAAGVFSQWGGSVKITNELDLGSYPLELSARGDYSLHDGGLAVHRLSAYSGHFAQHGGTNRTEFLTVGNATYELEAGLLASDDVQLGLPSFASPMIALQTRFIQRGGDHQNSRSMRLGSSYAAFPGAVYQLDAGQLTTPGISITWFSRFVQNGGTNSVTSLGLSLPDCQYHLNGGLLATTRTGVGAPVPEFVYPLIVQNGGVHRVDVELNLFRGDYQLMGGTLIASNIQIESGRLHLQGGGVINPGAIAMLGGSILAERGDTGFGPFAVGGVSAFFDLYASARPVVIEFTNAPAVLRFAGSSGVPWSNAPVIISHWAGSLLGGGQHQILFGTSRAGLSAQQLGQVLFANPSFLPPGAYTSRQLSSGELVPHASVLLTYARAPGRLVLRWPSSFFVLQTTTNVTGPYLDLFASPPYTNLFNDAPQRFFRLRGQWNSFP